LDVFDYLQAAWTRRRVMLVAALVLAGLGAAWSLLSPRRYEASLTLAVVPSKLNQPAASTAASVANFAPIIASYAAVAPVVKEFKLDQSPREITPARFVDRVLTVKPLVDTNLVRVVVELDAPDLAAKVANRLVDSSIAVARAVNQREILSTLGDLERVIAEAESRMKEAEVRYDEYRRTAQLELLRKDVETLLTQRGVFKGLLVDIQAERGKVAQAEAELAKRQPITTLKRSIDDESALLALVQERRKPEEQILGLQLNSESVNEVYQDIDSLVAESRAKLAQLEKQRDELVTGAGVGASEMARLNDLYSRESMLSRLELERTIARKSFEEAAARYQTAHLEAIGRTPQVVVVDSAVPPEGPVSRLLVRNTALGLLSGVLLGLLVTVADVLRGGRPWSRPV
jgi:capsular polysaccharide biosynthesis protein